MCWENDRVVDWNDNEKMIHFIVFDFIVFSFLSSYVHKRFEKKKSKLFGSHKSVTSSFADNVAYLVENAEILFLKHI